MKKLLPSELLSYKKITPSSVELNAYSVSFDREINRYGKTALVEIYRDMFFIRRFEEILLEAKNANSFNYASHLSIGQEAVAVGQALALKKEDVVFGTHRSHGEMLAKCLRAINLSNESEIEEVLLSYPTPTYKAVSNLFSADCRKNAMLYIAYGAFAEIFARVTGLQRGCGGSMHLHFTPFGSYPNNAIVGGSAPLAVGSALYNRVNDRPGLVVANLGDGALGCGAVYEAISFANMNQFQNSWKDKKGLPLIFLVSDNLYARGGNTLQETGAFENPALLGAPFDKALSETVNGLNPLAVADAVTRHRERALKGNGTSILSCTTYRHGAHSIGDKSLRSKEEENEWLALDPLKTYSNALLENGVITKNELVELEEGVRSLLQTAYSLAINQEISPPINLSQNPNALSKYAFNNGRKNSIPSTLSFENNEEYLRLTKEQNLNLRDAISLGIIEGFQLDQSLIAYGEDVRGWSSPSSVFYGLEKTIPVERLFNTSISESAIVGAEVGYAMRGGSVISELLYADFLTRSADEIINQTAKWQSLSGGMISLPLTLRLPVGRSYGGQHSQDLSGIIARVPGLKVYYPVTPNDALNTVRECLSSTDPSIIFEPKEYYLEREKEDVMKSGDTLIPTAKKLDGDYCSVVTIGSAYYDAYDAIKESKRSVDLFSLVRLAPIDYGPIIDSVKKTGKLIVMGESTVSGGLMSDVVATIQKECFAYLKSPVEIVGLPNSIIPPNGVESGIYNLKQQLLKLL